MSPDPVKVFEPSGLDVPRLATAFGRMLRDAGVDVPPSSIILFNEALSVIGIGRRSDVYWAGQATLLHRPEDRGIFDQCFSDFWEQHAQPLTIVAEPESITVAFDSDDDSDDEDGAGDSDEPDQEPTLQMRFSAQEVLRHKDFEHCTSSELDELHRILGRLRLTSAPRRSRRLVRSPSTTARLDVRRTVRAALRADGEAIEVHHRVTSTKPRRLVLLLDVSGSMELYARVLVRFAHAAVIGRQRVEVFALGTRLTRITRELSSRDPDRAIGRAADAVVDWAGGTRLGDGIGVFNDQWGQRGMARGAIVVILSDGWDRGAPEVMAEQMSRLSRVAHSVIWVNPLKATTGYAPLARGMSAALPYIDHFVEGHSLDAIERLAEVIAHDRPSTMKGSAKLPTTMSPTR
ncbi:MAG: VWA domain-containing protein [Acidimicrobiia bacterium]